MILSLADSLCMPQARMTVFSSRVGSRYFKSNLLNYMIYGIIHVLLSLFDFVFVIITFAKIQHVTSSDSNAGARCVFYS